MDISNRTLGIIALVAVAALLIGLFNLNQTQIDNVNQVVQIPPTMMPPKHYPYTRYYPVNKNPDPHVIYLPDSRHTGVWKPKLYRSDRLLGNKYRDHWRFHPGLGRNKSPLPVVDIGTRLVSPAFDMDRNVRTVGRQSMIY